MSISGGQDLWSWNNASNVYKNDDLNYRFQTNLKLFKQYLLISFIFPTVT